MTLDVYASVVIDPSADEWRDFWREAYVSRFTRHATPLQGADSRRHVTRALD